MIGIAVAFVVSSFYRRGISGMGQLGAAGFLLTGAYATAMMIGSIGNQITTSFDEAKGSGDYRTELLRRGLQEFWKSPIFGDSYANVVARMKDMIQGEGIVDFVNTYLYFALFAGGIGLVLFCLAFIIPISRLVQIRRLLPPASAERELAGFCLALLASAAVMLTFTSYLQRPSIFFLIVSSVALMMKVPNRAVAAKKPIDVRVKRSETPIVA
jgi:O-antigen ligase